MSYQERKMYRAKKRAGKYLKKSHAFDFLVALGSVNILGSYISVFISLNYFLLSVSLSLCVIIISFKLSRYFEEKAESIISDAARELYDSEMASQRKNDNINDNIIEVDFKKGKFRSYIGDANDEII